MQWTADQLTDLVIRCFTNQATAAEREQLEGFMSDSIQRNRIEEILSKEKVLAELPLWKEAELKEPGSLNSILSKLRQNSKPAKTLLLRSSALAAASVAALVFSIFFIRQYIKSRSEVPVAHVLDLKPGGQRATLTLASGRQVILDSVPVGQIATDAGSAIHKQYSGIIAYSKDVYLQSQPSAKIAHNTLTTPKGGTYEVVLPDHSVVYLNSGSSLTYPTEFSPQAARMVELTGEAYFAVQHDPARPFRVLVNGKEIDALGTTFDVNGYSDEPVIKATLLDGVVRAIDRTDSVLLRPGQQAQMTTNFLHIVNNVDTDAVVGWKHGDFIFNDAPIDEVMRQLGRWYNVSIKYDSTRLSNAPVFTAEISRNRPASEVLKALEVSGYHFVIVGTNRIEAVPFKP